MNLPVNYNELSPIDRKAVRTKYVELQEGKCYYCHAPLSSGATKEIMEKYINKKLFPKTFFNWPVHLHHSHSTGITIGAVHCQCNAVLWQYYKE